MDEQYEKEQELGAPEGVLEGAFIAPPPGEQPVRFLGSHPSVKEIQDAIARAAGEDGGGEGPGGGLGGGAGEVTPVVVVSVPDIAYQFSPCLPDNLEDELAELIKGDILAGEVASRLFPNPDIQVLCAGETERVGLWFRGIPSDADEETRKAVEAARTRALERLSLLPTPEDTFGQFISKTFLLNATGTFWDLQPKVLGSDFKANEEGPIHLTNLTTVIGDLQGRILTLVDGYDERPLPDVSFRATITDELSINEAGFVENDTKTVIDADTSWLNVLLGLTAVVGGLLWPARILASLFLLQRILVGRAEGESEEGLPPLLPDAPEGGIGAVAAALFRPFIPLDPNDPGGSKIIFRNRRVVVAGLSGLFRGVFSSGIWELEQ